MLLTQYIILIIPLTILNIVLFSFKIN